MAKAKQKRMSQDELEKAVTGGEPVAPSGICTQTNVSVTLNWYSNNRDTKDSQKYISDYFKKNKLKLDTNKSDKLPNTLGWLCRMVSRGFAFDDATKKTFDGKIEFIKDVTGVKTQTKETSNVISIQDRITQKVNEIAGELEYSIDELIQSQFKKVPSPLAIMQDKVKAVHASKLVDMFKKDRAEIQEVLDTDDEQLQEGYRNYSKLQLRKLVSYYDQIINDAIKLSDDSKKSRKPRKRKTKTPEQLVAKIKILAEDKELKLKSEDAKKIIGATQLWVFNTKTRKLGVYHADDASGLSVKGSSIVNYSEHKSVCKTLRKPETILPDVVKGGKVFLRNVIESINAKEKNLTGRLNSDTILVKII